MALPAVLKNFNLFNDANSWLGEVEEIKLPVLTRKMEEFRGAGMDGPVQIDLGQEKIEQEITLGGLLGQAYEQYGITDVAGIPLRFAGAYQRDDASAVQAVEIIARGRYTEIDPDTAKAGEKGKTTLKCALSYYKLSIDGTVKIEIDLLNMKFAVNGIDMLAAQRTAIGL